MEKFIDEMGTKVEMVVQSHLSDALMEMSFNPDTARLRINFAKHLVDIFDGDLTKRINVKKQYAQFYKSRRQS